jgi:hypothetical protein
MPWLVFHAPLCEIIRVDGLCNLDSNLHNFSYLYEMHLVVHCMHGPFWCMHTRRKTTTPHPQHHSMKTKLLRRFNTRFAKDILLRFRSS